MVNIKLSLLFIVMTGVSWKADAQSEEPFSYVEHMPEFIGGQAAMYSFISSNVMIPEEALNRNISGTVIAKFAIDVDSTLKRITILQSIGFGYDEEVIRLINLMSEQHKWIPGRHNLKNVPVWFTLPISFQLKHQKKVRKKSLLTE